ncbi:MAG: carboxypeptidase-like regulatory domain-containing protein, partial [Mucilaginibacter sp.]
MQNFYRIRHSSSLLKGLTAGILPLILTTLLIFTFVIPASATDGQTINNTRISIMAEDLSIKAVFNIIESKTTFIIGYDNTVDVTKRTSLHIVNKTVSQVLQQILKDYRGTISQVDEYHVLIRVEKAPAAPKMPVTVQPVQVRITGTVVDEKDLPLPGVSVYEKTSHKGTATDVNGKYTVTAEQGATLVFSFVGYASQEVVVGSQAEINIKLKPAANILNEVVAIGYQTVRKSDFTGAVASVKANELNLSAPTVGQALVGKVAGV